MSSISQKELVSIGLPTYNGLPSLKRAIDSVLGQTYPNIELIITDNPSTDGTQALCEELIRKDSRVRYMRHKENIGAINNYNSAFRASRGEYFCWVSYDDFLDAHFVEKCLALLRDDKEAVMAMGDFAHVNIKGEVTHKMDPDGFVIRERDLYARLKKFILMYWWDGKVMAFHGLWRRAAIANDTYRDLPDGDMNFVFRGLSRGPFLFVNEVLFYKGVLPGGESREHEKLTFKRIIAAVFRRFTLVPAQLWNTNFILNIKALPFLSRVKLIWWNLVAASRFFTKRKF